MFFLFFGWTSDLHAKSVGFFVGDVDAMSCEKGVRLAGLSGVEVAVFTEADTGSKAMEDFVKRMDVAVVDIMQREPGHWLLEHRESFKSGVKLYAVRKGANPKEYEDAGFLMDEDVRAYYEYNSSKNLANLIRFIGNRDLGLKVTLEPPQNPPKNGFYHPASADFFASLEDYVAWYKASGHYRPNARWDLMLIFSTFTIEGKREMVDALIAAYEREGINVVVWMQEMKDLDKNLERIVSSPPLDSRLGSITAFTLKFASSLSHDLIRVLEKANVPVFNVQTLFFETKDQWLASQEGISSVGISMQFSVPELSGLVEPTVIGAKEKVEHQLAQKMGDKNAGNMAQRPQDIYRYVAIDEHVKILAQRVANWHRLKDKLNKDKRLALIYYNHSAGKQNIGASYLNVFRSISEIIAHLKAQGYGIKDDGKLTEERIKELVLKSGRNIGTWAPDELNQMLAKAELASVSIDEYKGWFAQTPQEFQEWVIKEWGRPEDSRIMTKDGRFFFPVVRLGNLILAPQPVRGWSDDPMKLYHSTTLPPHHQYIAFYLWLQRELRPDAMISLGTHGTHEWLPGKQAGLSWRCAPEVLIGGIPSIYPYIVDDVGEGIQAKRRGRAVVIDHATPPMRQSGLSEEYSKLSSLISEYDAASQELKPTKFQRIREVALKTGIQKDLGLADIREEDVQRLEHYLMEIKTAMMPYGLHTFGVSMTGDALNDTTKAITAKGGTFEDIKKRLEDSGPSEISSLIKALSAGYVSPASGNDPIRNPESIPTGKDFYGFDPEKVPSKDAWAIGEKRAQELIDNYRKAHDGEWPEQVGLVLWSVETIRDEGINVATALSLMGMKPVWDKRDKIKDVAPIPGEALGRPRIDVLLQISGLFRDTFPNVAKLLDKAVKQAANLKDVENFIARHSKAIEERLVQEGKSPDVARKLSLVRVFGDPPGAYGTKVDDFAGASGLWKDDRVVAEQGFIAMQSHGYSDELWGEPMTPVYRQHLRNVKATVHTLSSNLYGTMDNDDVFQYLGGLSMAVRVESGKAPDVFVSINRQNMGRVEALSSTLGRELRSRYLNPKWIEGMKREGYAGAREMNEFLENMWGWQVTTPKDVTEEMWHETYEVYVEDKYGMELKKFFDRTNPWAYQAMTARMLEAVRHGYWKADDAVQKKLSVEYALNVIEKGVACCDHTCNNPLLNQMVYNILSVPGVLAPDLVERFKIAIEKANGKRLEDFVQERSQLLDALTQQRLVSAQKAADVSPSRSADTASRIKDEQKPADTSKEQGQKGEAGAKQAEKPGKESENVKGYKMEEKRSEDKTTQLSSSGIQWWASVLAVLAVMLIASGMRKRR